LCTVDNLSTSIEFLDFSTDNFYLLYKDSFEEVVIIDLSNLKKINTVFVEFDIEWCSDGIKASDKAKVIFLGIFILILIFIKREFNHTIVMKIDI